jgi:hypothetical protein
MKKLCLTRRLEYWKYQCAALTFWNAEEVARYLDGHKQSPLEYQLLTSLYVLYGRPFKQRRHVRIPDELVPTEYLEEHELLLDLRDKMFAHVDTDGLPDQDVESLSKILLRVRGGTAVAGMASLLPSGFQYQRIGELCDHLHSTCDTRSQDILHDAMDGSCPPDLTYEIDLRPDPSYLVKPVEWKGVLGRPFGFYDLHDHDEFVS